MVVFDPTDAAFLEDLSEELETLRHVAAGGLDPAPRVAYETVGQPLLIVLGEHPTFFVAHRTRILDLVLSIGAILLVP